MTPFFIGRTHFFIGRTPQIWEYGQVTYIHFAPRKPGLYQNIIYFLILSSNKVDIDDQSSIITNI